MCDAVPLQDVLLESGHLATPDKGAEGTNETQENDDLDSKSSDCSIYSGLRDIEIDTIALDSRKIFAEEFRKIKQLPIEKHTMAVMVDAIGRLRSLLLQCAYNSETVECVLSLLDPHWMLCYLDEYPAYGIPLQQDCDKFTPNIVHKKLRGLPGFLSAFLKVNLLATGMLPFYLQSEADGINLDELIQFSKDKLISLMNSACLDTYDIGVPFQGVLGIDRGTDNGHEIAHYVLLPTRIFAKTLLVHTDACGGETRNAPFPFFVLGVSKNGDSPIRISSSTRRRRPCGFGEEHGVRVQLVDTHAFGEGVVLVGAAVLVTLGLSEGAVVVLRQLPPMKSRCIPRWN